MNKVRPASSHDHCLLAIRDVRPYPTQQVTMNAKLLKFFQQDDVVHTVKSFFKVRVDHVNLTMRTHALQDITNKNRKIRCSRSTPDKSMLFIRDSLHNYWVYIVIYNFFKNFSENVQYRNWPVVFYSSF
ncbi:hypothetical protein JYU34_016979 [Plutella xylostella]|uniref:Uncharacterized protein n=1 Tax=Plutella xylostella TaxID=51655 RepID=A0ABQ7Q3Y8_PLUXY|nr:hypothetical protein JYU34_016979 [Plutella xylostella]